MEYLCGVIYHNTKERQRCNIIWNLFFIMSHVYRIHGKLTELAK